MSIFSVYVINRAGGLIYQHDNPGLNMKAEHEKTFSYPLDLTLKIYDEKITVAFGQRDGIKVGHVLLSVNGQEVKGQRFVKDNSSALEYLEKEQNFPVSLKFGKLKLSANERIMLASMFHSLFAIACQLSPVAQSSGIQVLETDTFHLHCMQTLTGVKFIVITEPRASSQDDFIRRLYQIYADYALKNPFYSIDMPIRCELFDKHLSQCIAQAEVTGRLQSS